MSLPLPDLPEVQSYENPGLPVDTTLWMPRKAAAYQGQAALWSGGQEAQLRYAQGVGTANNFTRAQNAAMKARARAKNRAASYQSKSVH